MTPGAENSECYVTTDAVNGIKYRVRPPQTIRIKRSNDDLIVKCQAPGNREKTLRVPRSVHSAAALNITNGIVPGVVYDHFSGALYRYPKEISVDFTGIEPKISDFPAYEALDTIDPETINTEDMGPKSAEILSDYNRAPVPPAAKIDDEEDFSPAIDIKPYNGAKDGLRGRVNGTYLNN